MVGEDFENTIIDKLCNRSYYIVISLLGEAEN